jgi:hypothetical protein
MSEGSVPAELRRVVEAHRDEIAKLWLEAHLAAAPVQTDDSLIRDVHGRAGALLDALAVALGSESPGDWGSFAHREVVQLATMMARALAEGGATATSIAGLATALGAALECRGCPAAGSFLAPLAGVATEAVVTARVAALVRQQLDLLARTTPVLTIGRGAVLVAACGAPDLDAAHVVVERALQAVVALETSSPAVVLDLSSLEGERPEALSALLSLPAELAAMGGRCGVVGLTPPRRDALRKAPAGVDLDRVVTWASLEDALAACVPRGILGRIKTGFRL